MGNDLIRPTVGGGPRPSGAKRAITGKEIPTWSGTKEQENFREDVLKACIQDKEGQGKTRYSNLIDDDLRKVEGTNVQVKRGVEEPVKKFLEAGKKALKAARDAAEAKEKQLEDKAPLSPLERDVLLTDDIGITGYRTVEKDESRWLGCFKGYYNRTGKERGQLPDPHGDEAIKVMVRFIAPKKAPPGFSFHTKGVAIDFIQKRIIKGPDGKIQKAEWVTNSTGKGDEPGQRLWWCKTWLYSWLHDHAKGHGFKQLKTEEWHYDYVGTKTED